MGVEAVSGQPLSEQGLVDDVIDGVRRLIREERLRAGDRLPAESALADRFDVSRPVVREAFRSLAALKVITMSAGRRAVVSEIDAEPIAIMLDHAVATQQFSLADIYEFRRSLEMRATELAATRRSDRDAAQLRALAAEFEEAATDIDRLLELDLRLHFAIARCSGNRVFERIVEGFGEMMRTTWALYFALPATARDSIDLVALHRDIALAVADGDRDRAVMAMKVHFEEVLGAFGG